MKGVESPLSVSLRIRPLNEDEIMHGATPVAHGVEGNMVVLMDPTDDPDDILRAHRSREKQYVFDNVFDGMTGQEDVFEHTTKSLISNVIHGYNATVFAYGATGAGKTYTMLGTQYEPGIMPQTLNALFQAMEETQGSMQYKVTMSYLEIYNEMIRDLLNPASGFLELREDQKGEINVAGLTEVSTRSTSEIMNLLHQGNAIRTQEPTKANKTSSRSHALLQVIVKQRNRTRDIQQNIRTGKLFLIDLAGSERASNTQNRGKRMVEGAHINRSLLALGNCINALSEKGAKYVNYRDSKLTRLLKDALGGNCKTVMIAHISPASLSFEESRNTLVYADRAKHIKTKVRKNLIDVQYHVAQYTAIIQELREEIEILQTRLSVKDPETSIKAIQNEVYRREHEVELANAKERLLTAFKDQMELRESWMELNTALIEIEAERSRNIKVVTEWESERVKNLKRKGSTSTESDNREKELEKLREMQGYSEEVSDSVEVQDARQEIKNLAKEMHRTEQIKLNVEKEIIESRQKISSMVEELPRMTGNKEHLEILTLLCKVHEKEIENTELKMQLLLRQHEMEHNESVIQTYSHHRNLCDEIIQQQRALIDDHNISCPKELEELYELYQQDQDDHNMTQAISLPSLQHLKVSSLTSIGGRKYMDSDDSEKVDSMREPVKDTALRKQLLKKSSDTMSNYELEKDEKLFSHSPRSKQLKEAQDSSNTLSPPGNFLSPPNVKSKEDTLYSISVRSNSSVDSPFNAQTDKNAKQASNDGLYPKPPVVQRKEIANNTRNIAALAAAKKRNKQLDPIERLMLIDPALNKTYISINSNLDNLDGDNYLSSSRLANHDKTYGSVANVKSLLADDAASFRSFDKRSMLTDTALLKTTMNKGKKTKGATRKLYRNDKHKKPTVVNNSLSYQQMAPEEFFQQLARGGVRKTESKTSSNIPLSRSIQKKRQQNRQLHSTRPPVINDIMEFDTTPTPPSTVYQMNVAEKGRGLTVQKRFRGPDSNASTPQLNPGQKNGRRPPPTIPASYRRGDMSVTGLGLK